MFVAALVTRTWNAIPVPIIVVVVGNIDLKEVSAVGSREAENDTPSTGTFESRDGLVCVDGTKVRLSLPVPVVLCVGPFCTKGRLAILMLEGHT